MDGIILSVLSEKDAELVDGTWSLGDGQTLLSVNYERKNEFVSTLEANGWKAVKGFNVGSTEGRFFTRGGETLYCYENPRTSIARAVYGATFPMDDTPGAPVYDDTMLYMFETRWEDEPYPGGMTYLIRLRDGRFIIIDGGFEVTAKGLVAQMRRLHPRADEDAVFDVAAWIFTHPHDDHVELIKRIHADGEAFAKIKIHSVISNSPAPEIFAERCPTSVSDGAVLRELTAGLCEKGAVFFKPHTGMSFNIGELEFKIFYTQNEWTPSDMIYLNDASTVFSVSREGGRTVMMLGDIMEFAGAPLMAMYTPDELRADAVQVAHHAVRGPEIELYEAIRPKLCFWNMQPVCYDLYSTKFKRNVLLRELDAFHVLSCFGSAQITV